MTGSHSSNPAPPLVIEFLAGSRLYLEPELRSPLPILHNGPPGTFVDLRERIRVSLPTDQIVAADDAGGAARVGFGGMRFEGLDADGELCFRRVRDLWPEARLSPERGRLMRLKVEYVRRIEVDGHPVWPSAEDTTWQPPRS